MNVSRTVGPGLWQALSWTPWADTSIADSWSLCPWVAVWPPQALGHNPQSCSPVLPSLSRVKKLFFPSFVLVFLPSQPSAYQASTVPLGATVLSPQRHLVSHSVNNTATSTINTQFAEHFHRHPLSLTSKKSLLFKCSYYYNFKFIWEEQGC